jgi:hypothetical protein
MALQLQRFPGFSPEAFAEFKAKVNTDTGVEITSNVGTVTHGSFVFTYNYDPNAEVLLVQCQKKPLFIPAATIINGLNEEVLTLMAQALQKAQNPAPAVTS